MARRVRRQPADARRVLPDGRRTPAVSTLLETLVDTADGEALPLPPPLAERYGGGLSLPGRRPYVIANFVATLDGVVSYALPGRSQASLISGGNEADRFVLALLRACADTIVVGAGTLRAERDHIWTSDFVFPEAEPDFLTLREAMGKPERARIAFVSASGNVDRKAPVFGAGLAVDVITGRRGASDIVATAGGGLVLCEGGPSLLGLFLREHALDELFMTTAPQLAGRSRDAKRPGLLEGHAFKPEDAPWAELVSLKRSGDFVFSRYRMTTTMSSTSDRRSRSAGNGVA